MTENLVPNGTEVFGDERLNEQAMLTIRRSKGPSEVIHACAGFDFGNKVIAVTSQRVRICNNKGNTEFLLLNESISDAVADGRTLVIVTSDGIKQRYRMSRADVVLKLAGSIRPSRLETMPDRKETHAKNCENHEKATQEYFITRVSAWAAFTNLGRALEDARKAAVESGALEVDDQGRVVPGWYREGPDPENQRVMPIDSTGVIGAGGALGLAGAIGAPAGAWALAGAFGTASTGAAISGLSGAAATSATAAWFGGGAVAAGGLGVAAAPFVLSGIGAVVGLGILGVAALIVRDRNSRNEKAMDETDRAMVVAELRMDANSSCLRSLEQSANQISTRVIKATGVLEALGNDEAATLFDRILRFLHLRGREAPRKNEAAAALDQAMREAGEFFQLLEQPLPYTRLYIGTPSPVLSLTETIPSTQTVRIKWADPDRGESEIHSYRIIGATRFWERDKVLGTVTEPEFTNYGLEPGRNYRYRIVPINHVAEGDSPETFEVRTQPT